MPRLATVAASALAAVLTLSAGTPQAAAQADTRKAPSTTGDIPAGVEEYRRSCLACHGPEGQGDGPVAPHLKTTVPDLTRLAERNDGTFPEDRVIAIIDGRGEITAHGGRTMPVWGARYKAELGGGQDDGAAADTDDGASITEHLVRARILDLTAFLKSIQHGPASSGFPTYTSPR